MKIAFTFNLRVNDTEEEAEFDSEETINRIQKALESFGHIVEKVELSQPIPTVVNQLCSINPDLIFNVAEGRHGRLREAFWPAIFEELKIPFTGSDAYSLALTLNKDLTKKIVNDWGILTPKGQLITSADQLNIKNFNFPLFIKPNFEGSSKGIDESNIVESEKDLKKRVQEMIKKYPDGLIVEEYIHGNDITVPFLEAETNDPILDPIVYTYDQNIVSERRFNIYDYELKNDFSDYVGVEVADLTSEIKKQIKEITMKVLQAVNCRDFGRLDFRLTPAGKLYFLEINCLASLEKGAGIFLAAENRGINEAQLINSIVKSAVNRYKIPDKKIHIKSSKKIRLKTSAKFKTLNK